MNSAANAIKLTLLLACSGCGGEADPGSSNEAQVPTGCETSPISLEEYETPARLDKLLIGSWQRCLEPQARGEDVGVEFATGGRWYALTRDAARNVVRREGIDYGGTWEYFPPGAIDPSTEEPSVNGVLVLDEVFTSPPVFTNEPRQLRVLFSPVLSIYVPLAR